MYFFCYLGAEDVVDGVEGVAEEVECGGDEGGVEGGVEGGGDHFGAVEAGGVGAVEVEVEGDVGFVVVADCGEEFVAGVGGEEEAVGGVVGHVVEVGCGFLAADVAFVVLFGGFAVVDVGGVVFVGEYAYVGEAVGGGGVAAEDGGEGAVAGAAYEGAAVGWGGQWRGCGSFSSSRGHGA